MREKGFKNPPYAFYPKSGCMKVGNRWQQINISLTRRAEKSKGRVMRTRETRSHEAIWVIYYRRTRGAGSAWRKSFQKSSSEKCR
jgi:hypothetical protein